MKNDIVQIVPITTKIVDGLSIVQHNGEVRKVLDSMQKVQKQEVQLVESICSEYVRTTLVGRKPE